MKPDMSIDPRLSILMPTYNRAHELETTLDHFKELEPQSPAYEIVVIDNNSSDSTREVVERFQSDLPIRYLFVEKAGKNCALNRAIEEVALAEIVVFTDDDILPRGDWLTAIASTCERWPEHRVFGGKIVVVMPEGPIPSWTEIPLIKHFAFASHDISEEEGPYPIKVFPFGPNYWIRRPILEEGFRFDETIGPHPSNRILGDEILFLKKISEAGNPIIYTPSSVVGHRIQKEMLSLSGIYRRAKTLGRGSPHISGLCHPSLLASHPRVWRWLRGISMLSYYLRLGLGNLVPMTNLRVEKKVRAIMGIWYNRESLRLVSEDQASARASEWQDRK
jgi:glycosyltransferase involved in cell wall biosynthesis